MARFVPDSKTSRWVIISPTRSSRPDEHAGRVGPECIFCPGSETRTPAEVYRVGEGAPDQPGWKVRVVPNKYPITDIHEVIIHSPDDDCDFEDLSVQQVELIVQTYRQRYRTHRDEGQVLIFCNHGATAGASVKHPHSQLVVVPHQIDIDILGREPIKNVVEENKYFTVYCPDFSQWPYETWIAPTLADEREAFGDLPDVQLTDLAHVLKDTITRLAMKYQEETTPKIHREEPFTYNFYIYHSANWYIRIIPRLVHRAGFELGTGLNVNIIDPIEASQQLRGVDPASTPHVAKSDPDYGS